MMAETHHEARRADTSIYPTQSSNSRHWTAFKADDEWLMRHYQWLSRPIRKLRTCSPHIFLSSAFLRFIDLETARKTAQDGQDKRDGRAHPRAAQPHRARCV